MQLLELREFVDRRGWTNAGEFVDTGFSGAKASRPALDRLMADAAQRKFDCVLVWKLDRFGRSVLHLNQQLAALTSYGVRFIAVSQGLDTDQSNPSSRLMLQILASVAEFEREMIVERVAAGMRNAKVSGTRSGRPIGRPRKVFDREEVLRLRVEGLSIASIASQEGLGHGTVVRVLGAVVEASRAVQKASAGVGDGRAEGRDLAQAPAPVQ